MESTPRIKVLIADDHELTRLGLKVLISGYAKFEVVGVAINGKQALEMAKKYQPNVIVMDLQMPILNGLSAATEIKQISPDTRIIAYTSVEDPQIEVMTQTAPIDLYCPKDISSRDLLEAIENLGRFSDSPPSMMGVS